ncbi:perforin-1-like isoform X2 [Anguilla anguilla]|uniref:perforin-1-like isoform X2 n=1 Tax=Anguilla anguilla TaxID=7936 RepID=UPI0015AB21F4|nr:perforin-1-like isoform X2 [Anguilla anguilla]XP_035287145.1 perforin-1-like isoform X2 [Anguilla anguilla]
MAGLWRLLILGCACHFLCGPGVSGAKFTGTPKQCEEAEFVPGHNLAGEGLDIVKMERKGVYVVNLDNWRIRNGTCNLVSNACLSSKEQKLPAGVTNWRCIPKCKMHVTSKQYESSESLVKDTTSIVTNNWKLGLSIPLVAGVSIGGTHSREATFSMEKSKQDKYSFTSHQVHCSFYSYTVASPEPLHEAFVESLKKLPKSYTPRTESAYMDLIDTYGTHYITHVKLGGRLKDITAIKDCQAAMKGLTSTAVKDCLEVEASATYKRTVTLSAEARHCHELKKKMGTSESFRTMFSERHSEVVGGKVEVNNLLFSKDQQAHQQWQASLKTMPDVVYYSAKPLFFLMSQKDPAREGLKEAIQQYIKQNALVTKCSGSCQVGRRSGRDSCCCVCGQNSQMTSNCCPTAPGLADLRVYGLYARDLYGDRVTQTDGSVVVTYRDQIKRTRVIDNNNNPNWPETFQFGPIRMGALKGLQFTVYDADSSWDSDLLGQCDFKLKRGKVTDSCMFKYGTFFFSYEVTCAPSLGGDECQQYIPSPVSPLLARRFHSRNGFLAGEQWEALLAGNRAGFEDHVGE